MPLVRQYIEQQRRTLDIDPVITLDLIHRLAGPSIGREVNHRVDALERALQIGAYRHIALNEVNAWRRPKVRLGPVNLGGEIIDNRHLVAGRESHSSQVRPDEARSSSDQDMVFAFAANAHSGSSAASSHST